MPTPLSVSVIYNKSNAFGLSDDVLVIERLLKRLSDELDQPLLKPHYLDFREPLRDVDLQIHLEVPVYGAIGWSRVNIILVNAEQWKAEAYDAYLHAFDAILFRDPSSLEVFESRLRNGPYEEAIHRTFWIHWCSSLLVKDLNQNVLGTTDGFISLLGGSDTKMRATNKVIQHWKADYPPLSVYTTRKDHFDLLQANAPSHVEIHHKELSPTERNHLLSIHRGHLICSEQEGYGYAASHAEVVGAFAIMNCLPIFDKYYGGRSGIGWLSADLHEETLSAELDAAIQLYPRTRDVPLQSYRQRSAEDRFEFLVATIGAIFRRLYRLVAERKQKGIHRMPPIVRVEDCPAITVITPTYNRRKLLDIAFNNMLSTDYPKKKIQWIVIEDHEDSTQMATDKVIRFQQMCPEIAIKYIPIEGRMSIGQKRNLAVDQADHEIVLFMDDDDHYPPTSFRRRVGWLLQGERQGQKGYAKIGCCTMIAMYDLLRGVSAVNVPPVELPLCQRISEATLIFYKSAWVERPFQEVSMAEGESWIQGREKDVVEIPPQHVIVAFTHGGNQSSRRIPPRDQPPSCFWGFSRDYLYFIHGLVGVEIEEDHSRKK